MLYRTIKSKIDYQRFQESVYMPFKHPGYSTKAIHYGQQPDCQHGSVNVPIHASSTFAQRSPAQPYGQFDYSRCGNPTRKAFQACLSACHYAKYCISFSSGCAATSAIFQLFKTGDHLIICDDVYGGTNRLLNKIMVPKHGLRAQFIDLTNIQLLQKSICAQTRLIWIETPTNPTLKIIDIEKVVQVAKKHKILTVCDCTFDSPFILSPILLGVDIAYDSCTKYINGHSDLVMGCICLNSDSLYQKLYLNAKSLGGCPSVFDSFLCQRGHKTLALRVTQATKNAYHIAHYLQKHKSVQRVFYPGLESHPQHQVARKQMRGFGAMITINIKGGLQNAKKFLSALKVFTLAQSLGGVESLAQHPALMTHASVPLQQRQLLGIKDNLIRLSVGIEDLQDLLQDLEQALAVSSA